jgi:predicted anti-sigma-YlaC factor YlaD
MTPLHRCMRFLHMTRHLPVCLISSRKKILRPSWFLHLIMRLVAWLLLAVSFPYICSCCVYVRWMDFDKIYGSS